MYHYDLGISSISTAIGADVANYSKPTVFIMGDPYVHPDQTGNISVSYYNSKVETKVKVALEGISGTGIPVVKKIFYAIIK